MTKDDKQELAELDNKIRQLKYTLITSLVFTSLSIPFLYIILETTSLIYPIIISILGGLIGYMFSKYF